MYVVKLPNTALLAFNAVQLCHCQSFSLSFFSSFTIDNFAESLEPMLSTNSTTTRPRIQRVHSKCLFVRRQAMGESSSVPRKALNHWNHHQSFSEQVWTRIILHCSFKPWTPLKMWAEIRSGLNQAHKLEPVNDQLVSKGFTSKEKSSNWFLKNYPFCADWKWLAPGNTSRYPFLDNFHTTRTNVPLKDTTD